ncbi:tail terminator [Gordonia phage Strosahl]|uniref:Tail terminator n=5 Tax=Soupsvirus TaxID=1982562 RepID=A0A166YE19_9CAUD|nr:tail terminator [Gordonia phage Rosalind]YP_009269044.1 tail terminator [Gordonia phage KatherineG]YP_009269322.1 tail terminator [Gordonia phage Soups]YP_009281635.1 tail terminator [Gordonia phage Remus]YP_009285965.1 tail terminator [Gordonia phage JSwag]YP_009596225.1 tail terminator [Gordonia phage Strosahl]YP_009624539.1 tail terminator [Gordonia phage Waits]ASZ73901.1 tail terminator [Gordonia phage ShayRa]AXH47822.1 tail terminator [Gordonia phage LastResort]QDM56200.1 tail term
MSSMPRIQEVLLPILRGAPELEGVTFNTWVPTIDLREFPLVNLRRIGGGRHLEHPTELGMPTVEVTVYSNESLIEAERIYEDVLDVLYGAVRKQTQTPKGYLHSMREPMGATQFSSLFMDSWRVQGLLAFGLRPPR